MLDLYYDFHYKKWFLFTKRNPDQNQVIFITDYRNCFVTSIVKPNINNFNFASYDLYVFANVDKQIALEFWHG